MTYPAGAQRHGDRRADNGEHPGDGQGLGGERGLDQRQKEILDRLQAAGTGLTIKQLEASLCCSAQELQPAVEDLLKRHLISELNTIIPSYVYSYPGIRLYAE